MDEYNGLTNEEYRERINNLFKNVEKNSVLKYFYILIGKLLKEWL